MFTLADIVAARGRLNGFVVRTPLAHSMTLSALAGGEVRLKLENLQLTGSFKARGALNRLVTLSDDDKKRGVIAASAGNHAQGVAVHATRLGIKSVIVMPVSTPLIKVTRTQNYGAEVVLHGENYDDAFARAKELAEEHGYVYVHAYDDDLVMAGQGTIGLEILEDFPDVDDVIVPVGGGGLIAGIGTAIKAHRPQARIIGVEPGALPSMKRALAEGKPVKLPPARTLAEGIAVRLVGQKNVDACKNVVDDIVTVEDDEIARAILFLLESEKTVAEGAGAAAVAALLAGRLQTKGRKVVLLVCGGNIDVSVLSRIIERGLVESGRLTRLDVLVPDRPGALAEALTEVARTRANVIEVHHERAFLSGSLGQVRVDLVVETRGPDHVRDLVDALRARGFEPSTPTGK
ncbi:MAG: threonine ammonia-lyase [Deltaproteobacteria bacterium]|nr:threonine ammonia-lyase [Deltaproteobacteria bacterium]